MKLTIKHRILSKIAPESRSRARRRIKEAIKKFSDTNISSYKFYQGEHGYFRDENCYKGLK